MTTRPVLDGWQALATAMSRYPAPRITQAMLVEYEELKRQEQRKQQLRDELVSLLEQGAEIEPGPLCAELRECERHSFSFAKLCALGGQQWAEDLRNRIEPISSCSLVVGTVERGVQRRYYKEVDCSWETPPDL
jgi:hypothetical protein